MTNAKKEPEVFHFTPNQARNFETVAHNPAHDAYKADVIVIGSGIAGMTCAAMLGAYGKKVVVLEQHDTPGGAIHCFKQGSHWVSAGWHYSGNPHPFAGKVWDFLTDGQKYTCNADEVIENYDGVQLTSKNMYEKMGISEEAFRSVGSVISYIATIKTLPQPFAFLAYLWFVISGKKKMATMNYGDWCKKQTGSTKEKPIWWAQRFDHGMPKERTCAALGAILVTHFAKGVMHREGGPHETVMRMVNKIHRLGGHVLLKANVTKITVQNHRVTGVVVDGTHHLEAKEVVIGNGVYGAVKLLGDRCPHYLRKTLEQVGPSTKHGAVFLTFDGKSYTDLGLPEGNSYLGDNFQYYVCHSDSVEGCVVYILWEMEYFPRGPEYESQKEDSTQLAFATVCKTFPKLADYDDYDAGTPATTEHYFASCTGASFGLAMPPERFGDYRLIRSLRPKTTISGLYLTGQDILVNGICGSMISAWATVHMMQFPGWRIFTGHPIQKVMEHLKKEKQQQE